MYVIPTYKNVMIGVENSEEGQIVDYDQMIRIIYLQHLNAQIDMIYLLPFQKTTLTSALLGTFWRALGPPEPTSSFCHCVFCLRLIPPRKIPLEKSRPDNPLFVGSQCGDGPTVSQVLNVSSMMCLLSTNPITAVIALS